MSKNGYSIATNIISRRQSEVLAEWIENREFEEYELPKHKFAHELGRPRNNLYEFMLTDIDCRVVMKVSYINRRYKWTRQLELILKHYLRDANRAAFDCCRKAFFDNLATPKPLAYWQKRDSLTQVKSYFLYQYTEANFPWFKVYIELRKSGNIDSKNNRALIRQKIIEALKALHHAGIRHGDVVTHNILMFVQNPQCLSEARVYFIDYDRATLAKLRKPAWFKRFFDLRDLRKMQIDDTSPYDMLKLYLGDDYRPIWSAVLTFWRWGGFNLFQWRNPDTCQTRKHMK